MHEAGITQEARKFLPPMAADLEQIEGFEIPVVRLMAESMRTPSFPFASGELLVFPMREPLLAKIIDITK